MPSSQALQTAHFAILADLIKQSNDKNMKNVYQWAIDGLHAKYKPAEVSQYIFESYAGKYGSRTIYFEFGDLFYQYGDWVKMTPFSDTYFMVENYDYFRVTFLKEKDLIVGFEQNYSDGRPVRKYFKQ